MMMQPERAPISMPCPAGRADDYDDWLAVGMALHSVGDDALLDDWEQWSAQSGKHKPSDCQRKWKQL
jgi:hypothetical protein